MTTLPPSASVALVYHRVGRLEPDAFDIAVTPENFAEQVEVIASLRPLALDAVAGEIQSGQVPTGGVVVTFDDGYLDNLTAALPVLERHAVPATVFVTTGFTDSRRAFWWDELAELIHGAAADAGPLRVQAGDDLLAVEARSPADAIWELWAWLRRRPAAQVEAALDDVRAWAGRTGPLELGDDRRVMTREELAALTAGGLVDLGAHTRTHPMLASLSPDDQRAEITGSRDDLQDWFGGEIRAFAYPFGRPRVEYLPDTARIVRSAGFHHACSVSAHAIGTRTRLHEVPRHTPPDLDGEGFAKWLSQRLRPPRGIRRATGLARERLAVLRSA